MPSKAKDASAVPQKRIDEVSGRMALCGGRVGSWSEYLTLAPALCNYVAESADAAADEAVLQRQREADLAKALSDNGVDLGRVKDGTAIATFGVTAATPCVDAYAAVVQGSYQVKRAVATLSADFTNALTKPDVRSQLGEYAQTIANSELDIAARQHATSEAARTLQNLIALNKENANELKRAGVGALFQVKNGNINTGDASANRHAAIARLFGGDSA